MGREKREIRHKIRGEGMEREQVEDVLMEGNREKGRIEGGRKGEKKDVCVRECGHLKGEGRIVIQVRR